MKGCNPKVESQSAADAGFSLVEVLAALALIGLALLPIYELNVRALQLAARLERAEQEAEAWGTALTILDVINPAVTCSGAQVLGNLRIEWRCELISAATRNAMPPTGAEFSLLRQNGGSVEEAGRASAGPFMVGLFSVDVDIERDGNVVSRRIQKFGWRRAVPYVSPL